LSPFDTAWGDLRIATREPRIANRSHRVIGPETGREAC
jgi:hypothetical protein